MPHSIRLRGPWEFAALGSWEQEANGDWKLSTEGLPVGGKVELPGSWESGLGAGFSGSVRLQRKFHQPTGLEANDRVWLVIESVEGIAETAVNGKSLAWPEPRQFPARFDITAELLAQNALEVTVTSEQGRAGGLGLVRLEIV